MYLSRKSTNINKYFDWLLDIDKPFNFLTIYMTVVYETVFLVSWFNFGLTNLTTHGKIIAVLFMLLFLKKCVYDYFKERRKGEQIC
jgi:hypothetical protein